MRKKELERVIAEQAAVIARLASDIAELRRAKKRDWVRKHDPRQGLEERPWTDDIEAR